MLELIGSQKYNKQQVSNNVTCHSDIKKMMIHWMCSKTQQQKQSGQTK